MKRLSRNQISQRDADIACLVLNGMTLEAAGAIYGIQRERTRQIVRRSLFRSSPEFCKKNLWALGIHANTLDIARAHKRYLITRVKAAIAPLAAPPRPA